jgi:predicted MFS family arabinose efflux permease
LPITVVLPTGAIGSGLMVQYLPEPTHLVYVLLFVAFAIQVVGVLLMPESSARKPGALASLRPRFAVPAAARQTFLTAVPALVTIWALVGFYASLGPALIRLVSGSSSFVLGGLSLFILAGSAGVTVFLVQRAQPRTVMLLGVVTLFVGVAATVLATVTMSTVLLLLGTAVAGVGFGAAFQGSLRTVLPLIAPTDRAGTLSVVYAVSYLAMGAPAVIGGYLAVHGGVRAAGREYGAGILVLAALALVGLTMARPRTAASELVPARCPQASMVASRP